MQTQLFNKKYLHNMLQRWQDVANNVAKAFDMSACLVMQIEQDELTIAITNQGGKSPYKQGDSETYLNSGLYCEHVISTGEPLHVKNATTSIKWRDNPDIALDMISYFGVPLLWPDKQPFGTFCLLDNKEQPENPAVFKVLKEIGKVFESELYLYTHSIKYLDGDRLNKPQNPLTTEELKHIDCVLRGLRHELETPLGICRTAASSITDELEKILKVQPKRSAQLEKMYAFGELLNNNLSRSEELMQALRKISELQHKLHISNFSLDDCLAETLTSFSQKFESVGAQLHISYPQKLRLTTSLIALREVIFLLLDNVYEHAGQQLTRVNLNAEEQHFQLNICIEDDGPGANTQDLDALFLPFFTTKRNKGLTGLGLFLVNRLTQEVLQGQLKIFKSEAGFGISLLIPKALSE